MELVLNGVKIPGVNVSGYSLGDIHRVALDRGDFVYMIDLSVVASLIKGVGDDTSKQDLIYFFSESQEKKTIGKAISDDEFFLIKFNIRVFAESVLARDFDFSDTPLELVSVPTDLDHFNTGLEYAPEWRSLLNNCGGDF